MTVSLKKITSRQQNYKHRISFHSADRWRGPTSTPQWNLDETPDSNPRIHLNNNAGKFEQTYDCATL
jgi:hypothetical protein